MAKILFVVHDLQQEFNYFPLGPGYIAANLIQHGHDVETYCMDVFHYSHDDLANHLKMNEYALISMGFLAARYNDEVKPLSKVINRYKKKAWYVLGGHGPSPIPEFVLRDSNPDLVSIGEGEESFLEILECYQGQRDLNTVEGIAFLDEEGQFITTGYRLPIKKLDELPFPAWSIFPMEKYVNSVKNAKASIEDISFPMVTSRGCINRCNFCYRMDKGVRVRSITKVVDEIQFLHNQYGATFFNFLDELFVISEKRVFEFRDELKRRELKIKYTANCRTDIFNNRIAEALAESGCSLLNIGFESTSQQILDYMNKNTTVEENARAAEIANAYDIPVGLNFIWGEPGDTAETMRESAAFIKKHNHYAQIRTIRPVTAYPGCDLYYEAIKKGLLKDAADFFDRFKNSDLVTVNHTDMSLDEIYEALYEVNKDLILDHIEHTTMDFDHAQEMIAQFRALYFEGNTSFRGIRKYDDEGIKDLNKD